jgi:hypothetical protein
MMMAQGSPYCAAGGASVGSYRFDIYTLQGGVSAVANYVSQMKTQLGHEPLVYSVAHLVRLVRCPNRSFATSSIDCCPHVPGAQGHLPSAVAKPHRRTLLELVV